MPPSDWEGGREMGTGHTASQKASPRYRSQGASINPSGSPNGKMLVQISCPTRWQAEFYLPVSIMFPQLLSRGCPRQSYSPMKTPGFIGSVKTSPYERRGDIDHQGTEAAQGAQRDWVREDGRPASSREPGPFGASCLPAACRYRRAGEAAVPYRNRERPSPRRLPQQVRDQVVELLKAERSDCNDYHLTDILAE